MTPARRREVNAAMIRFADGDRAAFRVVFDALWPVLLAFTSRVLPIRADAEDAAQRALLKLFDRIADLDRDRDGVAWAITIASYEVLTIRRTRGRRREQEDAVLTTAADGAARPDDRLADHELRAAVHATIGELSDRDQVALKLLLDDQPAVGETQRKRRFRAIERLRTAWRNIHG